MAFRSKLEEKVADLLSNLGVSYEYESTKVSYVIQHNYTPDFILPSGIWLETKGYWDSKDRKKSLLSSNRIPTLTYAWSFRHPIILSVKNQRPPTHNGAKNTE